MNVIGKHNDIPVGVLGDIHEHLEVITNKVKVYDLVNIVIFQLGDFGVGFGYNGPTLPRKEKKRLQLLNTFLKKRCVFLYVVRGNHDNPNFFDGKHNHTNIVFMQDYDVVEIGENKYLGIGGATCVDRKRNPNFKDYRGKDFPGRRENIDWWPGAEKVVYDEEKLKDLVGIDVVLTHTCPDFVYPPVIGGTVPRWAEYDPELPGELIEERKIVTDIYNKLNELNYIKLWYFGHFHQTKIEKHEVTEFHLLDVNEFQEVIFKKEEYE